MEITISGEQKELAKKAQEFSKKQLKEAQNGDDSSVRFRQSVNLLCWKLLTTYYLKTWWCFFSGLEGKHENSYFVM